MIFIRGGGAGCIMNTLSLDLACNDFSSQQVSLQFLSGQSSQVENELSLTISNISMTWSTLEGSYSDPNPIGDLSNWFSLVKESTGGGILQVYYPADESLQVVAFKKSLSQLISVGGVAEREARQGGVQVVREMTSREYQHHTVVTEKVRTNRSSPVAKKLNYVTLE